MIYAIDGSNVCFLKKGVPKLKILLELLIELRRLKVPFLCFFDGSTKHRLDDQEKDVYLKLLENHDHCFSEVTGGIEADRFILQWANVNESSIISNDQYRPYADEYPWLKLKGKLVKANVADNTLMVDQLAITKKLSFNLHELTKTLEPLLSEWKEAKLGTTGTQASNQPISRSPKLLLVQSAGSKTTFPATPRPLHKDIKFPPPDEVRGSGKLDKEAGEVAYREPFVLHLIFDRTTIDSNFWPFALAAFDNQPSERRAVEGSQQWNLGLRQSLAEALMKTLADLQQEVMIDLWWFADIERASASSDGKVGISSHSYGQSHGQLGSFNLTGLSAQLLGPSCNYSPGFDLIDAVDEVLDAVVRSIKSESDGQHRQRAVLIVADSPPPPSDHDDPIWQRLSVGAPLANERHSSKFREALNELGVMKIPVGWLFLRSTVSPEDTEFSHYLPLFSHYQTLKERVLEALRQVKGLLVEGCAKPEEMAQVMSMLFRWLKAK